MDSEKSVNHYRLDMFTIKSQLLLQLVDNIIR